MSLRGEGGAAGSGGRGVAGWETLVAHGFLPLCNPRAGLGTGLEYGRLLKSQWWSREEIAALQAEKLLRLARRAVASVPHYASLPLPSGASRPAPRELLATWPILTKAHIRAEPARVRSSRASRRLTFRATTGGTTGDPIEVWKNQGALAVCEAAHWRGKSWLGLRPWDKGLLAYGYGVGSWYGELRMRLSRKWGLEVFGTSEASRRAFGELLRRVRPAYVEGFVTDLLRLGETVDCRGFGIRHVIITGEMLHEGQREALARSFGARVSDYYGSNEVNSLAFECEAGSKHVTDEHVLLETVDEEGRPVWERPGRIVVTDLDNLAMPLVRYELGDNGVLTSEPCACGRKLTVLRALLGRTQDALRNEAGERLSVVFFAGQFKELQRVRRFQLVQKTLREVELSYEVAGPGAESEVAQIVSEIQTRLGPQMVVRTQAVEQLARTEVGKCRLVVGLKEGR